MNETTHNWCKVGFGDWCEIYPGPDKFVVNIKRKASEVITNFNDASISTAIQIANAWGDKPLYVGLSGGLDSEFTATTFLKSGIEFIPYILKVPGVNDTESWFANYFCWQNKLTPFVKTLSVEDYQSKILKRYLPELTNTHNVNLATYLYSADLIKSMGGYYLNSAGDVNLDFENKKFYSALVDFCLDTYRSGEHPTAFYMSNPEIVLSYIWQFDMSYDEQYNKIRIYGVHPRPKMDYLPDLYIDNKVKDMLKLRSKVIPCIEPHWYGSKQNIIDSLK